MNKRKKNRYMMNHDKIASASFRSHAPEKIGSTLLSLCFGKHLSRSCVILFLTHNVHVKKT